MKPSHRLALRASRSVRAPTGVQQNEEAAAATSGRTSEGPVPEWAPEAQPSAAFPTAHTPQEPEGSPPSRRSIQPVHSSEPAQVNNRLIHRRRP